MPKSPPAARGSARYGPELRLKRPGDFARMRNAARKVHAKHFLILLHPNQGPLPRLGIIVTKKVEPRAVGRNRIKRYIRELFRSNRFRLSDNFDIVVVARRDAPACSFEEVSREILGALERQGYLR